MFLLNSIGVKPEDGAETKLKKNFVVYLGSSMSMGGLLWGFMLYHYGLVWQSSIPFGYVAITVISLLIFNWLKKLSIAGSVQITISITLPFLLQWGLGGFGPSGCVMLWAIIGLLGSIVFGSRRFSVISFCYFIGLCLVSWSLDSTLSTPEILTDKISSLFFLINTTIICSIVFWLSVLFVAQWRTQHQQLIKSNDSLHQSSELLKLSEGEIKLLMTNLEASERKYRELVENSNDIVYETDGDGKITYANKMAKEFAGLTDADLFTKHFGAFLPEDTQAEVLSFYLNQAIKRISYTQRDVVAFNKDKRNVWLNQAVQMYFEEGQMVKTAVFARDITILKEIQHKLADSEKQYRGLVENSNDIIFECDGNGMITYANPAGIAFADLPESEIIGQNFGSFAHPDHSSEIVKHFLKQAKENREADRLEARMITPKGKTAWLDVSVRMVFENGWMVKSLINARDITDLYNTRKALEAALVKAEAANRAKTEFLANMSHEMRTPLNGIIGFTNLLLETKLNSAQAQYMDIVNKSAGNLLDLINDLLDFSKIEAGKMEMLHESVDLYDACAQALDIIRPQADKKNLEILIAIAHSVPRQVLTDGLRLKQVLVNLLGNAVKFTEAGEIELKIESLEASTEKYLLRFSVRDTGIGISTESQARIFDAFQQAESYTSKKYGGTGLGLSISNNLLNLMGSTLKLTSVPGQGSTFYFDIELDLPQAKSGDNGLASSKADDFEKLDYSGHVLLVEDNAINKKLAAIIIKNFLPGSILIEAENGKQAIEMFKQFSPGLILMDVQMPMMNGTEATLAIRQWETKQLQKNHTHIIALTAGTVEGERERCVNAGMDDYVSKPIEKTALYMAIRKWLPTGIHA